MNFRCYGLDEIPEELKGRGFIYDFGSSERRFVPFTGPTTPIPEFDWECEKCGARWFASHLRLHYENHCPACGTWQGVK